jgi:hypothetical protein
MNAHQNVNFSHTLMAEPSLAGSERPRYENATNVPIDDMPGLRSRSPCRRNN